MIFENNSKCFENTLFVKDDAKNIAMNRYKIDITIINELIFEKYCERKNV